MCDYSLEMYGSRPARESERYETVRFPSGSVGLASPGDCGTAVCVQYDTRMRLENIPLHLQSSLRIKSCEDATFIRLDHGAYRDGLRFDNGREISIQQLNSGVCAVIIPVDAPRSEAVRAFERA
jgi:hypothetical protein